VAGCVYLSEKLIPRVYGAVRFAVLSESTRGDLVRRGIAPENLRVIRSGIDHRFYVPPAPSGPPAPVMTYLGRLKKYKRIEYPILALPGIKKRVPGAEYWIVGEGDHAGALRRAAREAGVEGAVRFLGPKGGAEKLEVLHRTRVLTYTSPKEGWGLSVIEANACGVPVIASDSPGLCESVRHGETGFLVPHGDIAALEAAAARLLSDDALWGRMSRAGIEWARRFDWERMTDEMEGYAREIVAGRPAGGGRAAETEES
jgi:glycosyltransferase involved in cell wall biosynthesis